MHRLVAALLLICSYPFEASGSEVSTFWDEREIAISEVTDAAPVRIGIWDSGVDLSLFSSQIAMNSEGRPLVRGYDAFKQRQDTPMAVLPLDLAARRDGLNRDLAAFDDVNDGLATDAASTFLTTYDAMTGEAQAQYEADLSRWSGYVHGTGVADIAIRKIPSAQLLVARMEWWHGSPPVPCWTRELADREAASIGDLLEFLVRSGARVVNMSWGRFETSYIQNLEECAPQMSEQERRGLARYTVETIRSVLKSGMEQSPHVLFVAAAGNAGKTLESENPATRFSLPNLLLVGAVDAKGELADFSNTGIDVSLYANGYRIPARMPGGFESHPSGTSMATPNVTNAAAKIIALVPSLSGAKLKEVLLVSADTNSTGQRLLHPQRALAEARSRNDAKPASE